MAQPVFPGQTINVMPPFAPAYSPLLAHLAWVVDSVNGNDANYGDAARPLRTLGQLQQRWESKRASGPATIKLLGSFPTELLVLQATLTSTLAIDADATVQYSGTVDTFQALAAPATDAQLSDLGIGSWAPHVGRRVRLTSGANAGAVAWVQKDLGGNFARISQFINLTTGLGVAAAAGNTFVIETLPTAIGNYHIFMQGPGSVSLSDVGIEPIAGTQSYASVGGGGSALLSMLACETRGANSWSIGGGSYVQLRGCANKAQVFLGKNGIQTIFGHAAFATVNIQQLGSVRWSGAASCFQAARLTVNLNGQSDYNIDLAFFDLSTASCVTIGEGTTFTGAGSANGRLWSVNCTGAANYGVRTAAGGRHVWATAPTATSGGGNTLVGGVLQTWAAIAGLPQGSYLNPNNGASAGSTA